LNSRLTTILSYQGSHPLQKVEYYLNNYFAGSSSNGVTIFSFTPTDVGGVSGENTLRIVISDTVYNKQEITAKLYLQ